jgi:hypothetical protein
VVVKTLVSACLECIIVKNVGFSMAGIVVHGHNVVFNMASWYVS